MKEIIAIIRMNKVGQTRSALAEAGFCRMTATKVMGRGKMLKDLALLDKATDENREIILQSMLKGGRLIPKRLLSIIVKDEDVQKVVDTIIAVNKEGHVGDGKIFVLPVTDVIRVRTGETGEEAI
ncbi:nitrogen regulatory protein P-II [Thermincola ferriacetica]|uniref:Nitrogen regulatory protein P-II n=2 Tax=Thermincola TaxID=278993 RepID=D5XC11_THEPJ|nr:MULTISPECIES: P-II family nitrogen regulator [Thermincola]ADG81559.1 nitrogen regulatory protein P-II [Thermincola potens JR]KNZ69851.1 nitrogen regulatory protein P-II [Thermincola ferriacetica]